MKIPSILRFAIIFYLEHTLGTPEHFIADYQYYWDLHFDCSELETDSKRFAYSIETDGIKASVHTMKASPDITLQELQNRPNDWGFNSHGEYVAIDIDHNTVVFGLDSGRNDLYVATSTSRYDNPNDVVDREPMFRCSNERWQEMSGTRYGNLKNAAWMETERLNNPAMNVTMMIDAFPTFKCNTFFDFDERLQHFYAFGQQIMDFYQPKKWRRRVWKMRIRRQKAYEWLFRELIQDTDPSNVVIAYGGGRFDHASRGMPSTPNKHLFRFFKHKCRTRLVPERLTSQFCSTCGTHMEAHNQFWGVKKCTGPCSTTWWNRDVNACRNIRDVFLYRNDNDGDRPEPFVAHPDYQ